MGDASAAMCEGLGVDNAFGAAVPQAQSTVADSSSAAPAPNVTGSLVRPRGPRSRVLGDIPASAPPHTLIASVIEGPGSIIAYAG